MKSFHDVVIGAGLWGSVMAERIAMVLKRPVLVIESRDQIGGNCYSEFDNQTGIEKHVYGTHIFHTSNEIVWQYLSQFTAFNHYKHHVFTLYKDRIYNFPVNLKTINDFYGVSLKPSEIRDFLEERKSREHYDTPQNLEEQAVNLVGRELYEAFIRGYTEKQWEKSAKELPPSIIQRLPIREDYRSGYFEDTYEGLPKDGYGKIFERLLTNPLIRVETGVSYRDVKNHLSEKARIFYTGAIDEFFDYQLGELEYRSLRFEWERHGFKDYQGNSVINYADLSVPFTRIHEFKHLHPERREIFDSAQTVLCKEYPITGRRGLEMYYPIHTPRNTRLFEEYQNLAKIQFPRISFKGRLGGYRYADMDDTIADALSEFEKLKELGK